MSTSNRQFSLALESLTELKTEIQTLPSRLTSDVPTLERVLAEIGPLPLEALFLGVASDGLPVLLNLYDPVPGPMLIIGDAGSGKTAFLQSIAHTLIRTHKSTDLQFGVITHSPIEWGGIEDSPQQVGIFPVHHTSAQDFILSLASWAHSNKNAHQSVLLLIDGLESVSNLDFDAVQNLRWLFLRGPSRRVWPIVTMNAGRYGQVIAWLQNFRTRVFGRIEDDRVAQGLGADKSSALNQLQAQVQFSLRENENWLRFWLPGR